MGVHKFQDQIKWPEDMCEHCSNVIGPINVFGNDPNKHEGKGITLKPQWGGKCKGQSDDDMTQHAFIDFSYSIRSHTDPEHAKKFVIDTKRMDVPLCEIGKQLPFVHTDRQAHSEYPEIRKELDMKGVPRMVDIDGELWCKFCSCHKTYQAYSDGSWVSSAEICTNPECVQNGGPVNEWQKHIDNKLICPECEWHMQKGRCVNKLCEVYITPEFIE